MQRNFRCSICQGDTVLRPLNFVLDDRLVRVKVPVCVSLSCLITEQGAEATQTTRPADASRPA